MQLREATGGHFGVLAIFTALSTLVWVHWAYKVVLAARYRPWTAPYDCTASVIIPVVDEPLDLFAEVLQRILKQHPSEVIVVINGDRNEGLEDVCIDLAVRWLWTPIAGKRNALSLGVDYATGDIVVLVDSDTIWTDGALDELVKPFADPKIGGVTTRQRILDPTRHFFTRWADWLENSRALYSLPAQSAMGTVGCLPGRTIAFRTHLVREVMYEFMTARFLGVCLEVSDDRHLTNLALKAGYRTVYQSTSLVYTDAPVHIRKLYKQQLRWARGSQYNHLRMFPWVAAHAPGLLPFYFVDIALPFLLVGAVASWAWNAATHSGVNLLNPILTTYPGPAGWALIATAVIAGSTLSMWLRQWKHLREQPGDLLWMPAFVLFSSFFLMPVRVIGWFRMAHTAGWGTRANGYAGHRHRLNPRAAIPYVAGALILGAQFAFIAH